MKHLIISILAVCFFPFGASDATSRMDLPFKDGEWFKFRIHYGIFNASYATMELTETTLKGKEVYHVVGKGETTGLASIFFRVKDNYESYFDKKSLIPYKFIRQIDEGGHTKDLEIDFNHETNKATVKDHKHNTTKIIETEKGIQDLLSAFYFLRGNYSANDISVGEEIVLDMLYDNDKTYKFKLKFLGRETINSKFGKVKCLKFRPYVQSGRVFKEEESLTLWVSDDENKIPISVKADILVGSIKASLDEFKGLKHQFKIKMD